MCCIDLKNCFNADAFFSARGNEMLHYANEASRSKYGRVMHIVGPLLAVPAALITLAKRIVAVLEPLFKGILNIVGSLFSDECNAARGGAQLWECAKQIPYLVLVPLELIWVISATLYIGLTAPTELEKNGYNSLDNTIRSKE